MHRPRDKIENETLYKLVNESIFQSPGESIITREDRLDINERRRTKSVLDFAGTAKT